jgi:hypothetical protein
MKRQMLRTKAFRIALLTAVITGFTIGSSAQNAASDGRNELVGVWDVVVTLRNCSTGVPIGSFPSMAKYESGGTMTNQDVANIRTPVQGVWYFGGADTYSFAFKSFAFDASGAYIGYAIVRHDVRMARGREGRDEYDSEGTVTVYSPNGIPVNSGCSTAHGVRFK